MALLRWRSRRHEVLGADGHQRRQRPAAAARLAVEALGNTARGIQDGAGFLREHAAHDRRRALRDDAVQQHRGARRRNGQGAVALRRGSLQARPAPVLERVEAARHGVLARRRQAPRLPQQPSSSLLSGCVDRQAGVLVRDRRRGVADRRLVENFGHHARHRELAARGVPGPCHRREPGPRPRAAARSSRLRPGVQRPHGQARVDVLDDSPVSVGSGRRARGRTSRGARAGTPTSGRR